MKNFKSFRKRILPAAICVVLIICLAIPSFAGDGDNKYYSSYGSLDEVRDASLEINRQIGEESVVLMKNQDNILPLEGVRFVSVFGKAAEDPFYAGGGSGTAEGYYPSGDYQYTSVYDSLEAAGFSVNPALRAFYEKEAS